MAQKTSHNIFRNSATYKTTWQIPIGKKTLMYSVPKIEPFFLLSHKVLFLVAEPGCRKSTQMDEAAKNI